MIDSEEMIDAQQQQTPEEALRQGFAKVYGQDVVDLPKDLYIPPDALEIFLEAFEGPLDLLLYLIKKQNIDILDIPIAQITMQYMEYVEIMTEVKLELAGEYLVMAAMLAEIKSRMLLPRPPSEDGEEDDPRAELVRRLQEYERFKQAAQDLEAMPRMGRDIHPVHVEPPEFTADRPQPHVALDELLNALSGVLKRAELNASHEIAHEGLSVRERMTAVLQRLSSEHFCQFSDLFKKHEGRLGVAVTFIALLELFRQSLIELVQAEPLGPIHIKAVSESATEMRA